MHAFAIVSAFAAVGLAAPTPSSLPSNPYPVQYDDLFGLVAKVTKQRSSGAPLEVENYFVQAVHSGAALNVPTLVSPSTVGQPQTYVQNGTFNELQSLSGYLELYYSEPSYLASGIYGLTAGPALEDGYGEHGLGVDIGGGDAGAGIYWQYTGAVQPTSQPHLYFHNVTEEDFGGSSQFMVCDRPLYGGEAHMLFWRNENGSTPPDCAEVTLFAQCQGNASVESAAYYHAIQKTPCYPDAASIPVIPQE